MQLKHHVGLDAFTKGYLTAMFATEQDLLTELNDKAVRRGVAGWTERGDFTFEDLAPEALAAIVADCHQFRRVADRTAGEDMARTFRREHTAAWRMGEDFWRARNGHGDTFRGFLDDSAMPEPYGAHHLAAAKAFAPSHLHLDGDGQIRLAA